MEKHAAFFFRHMDISIFIPSFSLPKAVKRRINALKQLQVKCAHIEAKFYEEVHDLERKYAALYQPLFDKVGSPANNSPCMSGLQHLGLPHESGLLFKSEVLESVKSYRHHFSWSFS